MFYFTFVFVGNGTIRLGAYSTKWASSAVAARCNNTRQDNGGQSVMGRRENCYHYLQVCIVAVHCKPCKFRGLPWGIAPNKFCLSVCLTSHGLASFDSVWFARIVSHWLIVAGLQNCSKLLNCFTVKRLNCFVSQFHTRFVFTDGLQADPLGLRLGTEQQGHREQSQGIPPIPLREGADVVVWSFPWFLYGARSRILELQLHGWVRLGALVSCTLIRLPSCAYACF